MFKIWLQDLYKIGSRGFYSSGFVRKVCKGYLSTGERFAFEGNNNPVKLKKPNLPAKNIPHCVWEREHARSANRYYKKNMQGKKYPI